MHCQHQHLAQIKFLFVAGDTITFTAGGGTNYNFKVNGSSVRSNVHQYIRTSALNNGDTVTVDVTNANGCVASSSKITITVNALPVVSPITGTKAVCIGSTTALSSTPAGGVWSSSNTAVATIDASGVVTGITAGNSTISYTVTSAGNCSSTVMALVNVYALPTGSVTIKENSGTADDSTICKGANVKFTATATGTNYKFYLNGTGAPIQQGAINFINLTTLNNGNFITVLVTNGNNCSATFTSNKITVIDLPLGTLTASSDTICAGEQVDFAVTAGFSNYNFKRNNVTFQNGPDSLASYTGFLNGDKVTVAVSTLNSCSAIFDTITITVNPLPTGALIPVENSGNTINDGIICTGDSVVFTATSGYANYNFKLNGITKQYSSANTYTNYTLANNDIVSVEVTSAKGCVASFKNDTITVNTLPVVSAITGRSSVCVGDTVHLDNTNNGGVWSSTNNTIATVNTSGIVTGLMPGTDTISYTVTNANGCSKTVTLAITINALPVVGTITGNVNICTGDNSQLSDTSLNGIWFSDNTAVATVDAAGLVTGVSQGTAIISYTVTNASGCTAKDTAKVTVTLTPTVAPITTTAPSFDVCAGSSIPLKDATAGGVWSSSDNGIATISSAGVVTGISAGTDSIFYTITTTCLQVVADTVIITVHALPTATINSVGTPVCQGSPSLPTITFTGADGTAPYTFIYKINGGPNQTVTTASGNSVTVNAPTGTAGTFTYSLVSVSDNLNCSQLQTGSAVVVINTLPTAAINGTTSVCIGSTSPNITFTGANGTAPYTFTYNIDGGANQFVSTVSGSSVTVAVPTGTAGTPVYNLISVSDNNGCSQAQTGSATVTITPASAGGSVASDATVCSGSNTGTLTLTGQTGSVIRWESSTDGGATYTPVANTTTLQTYSNLTQTTMYRAVVQSGNCFAANSSPATITVNPASIGGSVNGSTAVCSGTNSGTLTLTGNIGAVVKWQSSTDGGTIWADIVNTTTTLNYSNLTQTTIYRAVVQSNPCTSANSNPATITVNARPTGAISGTTPICVGGTAALTLSVTGTGTISGTIAPGNIPFNGTAPTITVNVSPAANTTYTIATLSDANCTANASDKTGSAVITVNSPTPITNIAATPSTICLGSSSNLTASVVSTLVSEDFDGPLNFTQTTIPTTDRASQSRWTQRAGTYTYNGSATISFNNGSNFMLTVSDDPAFGHATNKVNSTLTSPTVSTVGYTALIFSYRTYYRHSNADIDVVVEVSTNGTTWTTVQDLEATGSTGGPNAFSNKSIDLSSYINKPNFQVRFRYNSNNGWYWAVDDAILTATNTSGNYSWTASPFSGVGSSGRCRHTFKRQRKHYSNTNIGKYIYIYRNIGKRFGMYFYQGCFINGKSYAGGNH